MKPCKNCGHANLHDKPAATRSIFDTACTVFGCNCGFYQPENDPEDILHSSEPMSPGTVNVMNSILKARVPEENFMRDRADETPEDPYRRAVLAELANEFEDSGSLACTLLNDVPKLEEVTIRADGLWLSCEDAKALANAVIARIRKCAESLPSPGAAQPELSHAEAEPFKPTGDMFWDDDDPEQSHGYPYDILCEAFSLGDIVKFQQAQSLPSFYGFLWPKNDGIDDDDEEHYFLTLKEAEDKLAELQSEELKPGPGEGEKLNGI